MGYPPRLPGSLSRGPLRMPGRECCSPRGRRKRLLCHRGGFSPETGPPVSRAWLGRRHRSDLSRARAGGACSTSCRSPRSTRAVRPGRRWRPAGGPAAATGGEPRPGGMRLTPGVGLPEDSLEGSQGDVRSCIASHARPIRRSVEGRTLGTDGGGCLPLARSPWDAGSLLGQHCGHPRTKQSKFGRLAEPRN